MKEQAKDFFTPQQEEEIVKAIKAAEKNTSGEIRVHLENHTKSPNLAHAQEIFKKVGMAKTEQRNGVLFYLAIENRHFSIVGDKGINDAVPHDFWDNIKDSMQALFKKGAFTEGLIKGIQMAGQALQEYFPYQKDDENELPDQISKS